MFVFVFLAQTSYLLPSCWLTSNGLTAKKIDEPWFYLLSQDLPHRKEEEKYSLLKHFKGLMLYIMTYYYIFSQDVKTNDQMLLLETTNSSAKTHPNSVNIQMFTLYNNHHE